ncbi:MAG TPA: HlyD family efflux transporter periplasmic adaptor subunit [Chthoniobacteraceae bacterium]|jgi:biotin carboxyl carrier protein|nr:HlyD family efflux transporter periplasmic adaptor subunit [Chthoniobacteraceae bacterium]
MSTPAAPVRAPESQRAAARPPARPSAGAAPDVQRLQPQLAARAEDPAGLRPLLEFLRELLAARALAWLGAPGVADAPIDCVAAERAGAGASLVALRASLAPDRALALPAPEAGADIYHLSTPVLREGALRGWLVGQLAAPNPRDLSAYLALLQAASGLFLYREQRSATAELGSVLERASGLLEIFRHAGGELDFDKACALAVAALREEFACERITLGYRRRGGVRVQTISGVAHIDPKNAAHQPYEAVMKEALAKGDKLEWTTGAPASAATAAHELLARETGAGRLLTLPLPRGRGALVLEWNAFAEGADPLRGPALAAAASGFVPVLFDLIERARPHPTLFSVRRAWLAASIRKRRLWLGGLGAVALLLACPFHHQIRTSCRVAPVTKRVIAAPFDGVLRHAMVRPGDRVAEGAALGELDNRELKMKEGELIAARAKALKQRDRAMSNSGEGADFANAQVAHLEAQSLEQELALVQRKLSLLQVTAPLAGVVVSGDLRRAEGQPVRQGEVLWEVAPLDEMIVEVEVPAREISRVREGRPVKVRLEGLSGSWTTTVERIHPQSEPRDGRNVFICEAALRNPGTADFRPGIRGRASVESDRRPLGWILGHQLWDWLVTTLFWS